MSKILLIDDSAMLRRIAANILHAQPANHDVVVASRAVEGFALACVGGIELILIDYLVAGLADAPLCRRFLADVRTALIPTILMIGQGVRPPPLDSLPANVVDTLVKPFAPEQLCGMVKSIVGSARTATNLRELRLSLRPDLRTDRDLPTGQSSKEEESFDGNRLSGFRGFQDSTPAADATSCLPTTLPGEPRIMGNTANLSLRNVMHAVAETGRSGVLRLWPEVGGASDVIFDQGRLAVVATHDGQSYAEGADEAMPSKVSPATLEEAVAEQNASGIPFLLTLGTHGLLSKSTAVTLLHRFGQRHFARLWPQRARPPVRFEFRPLDALPQYVLRLAPSEMSLDTWLLEASRLLKPEDVAMNLRHEGLVGTPFFQTGGAGILRSLELNGGERACLALIDGRTDLPSLAAKLGLTREAFYLLLFRFRCLDALGYRTAPAAFVMTPRTNLRRVLPLKR